MTPFSSRRPVPLRVWVAAAVTVVVAPFLVVDALRDDEGAEVAVEGAVAERPATSTTVAAGPTTTGVPPISIDTRWFPMGTSSYGETDDETQDRIDRRRGLVAAALPPPTTTTTTGPDGPGSSTTSTTAPRRATTTVPAAGPAPTAPPTVPPTPPPTTAPPTTAPPAPPTSDATAVGAA